MASNGSEEPPYLIVSLPSGPALYRIALPTSVEAKIAEEAVNVVDPVKAPGVIVIVEVFSS